MRDLQAQYILLQFKLGGEHVTLVTYEYNVTAGNSVISSADLKVIRLI